MKYTIHHTSHERHFVFWCITFAAFLLGVGVSFTVVALGATTVGNNTTIGGTLNVAGTASVSGGSTFAAVTSSQYVSAGTLDGSNINFSAGSINVGNQLSVDGASYMSSTLWVSGTSTFFNAVAYNGSVTIGDTTSTDIWYLNARIAGSIIPRDNNGIDLGEYARAYNDIFASGTVYASSTLLENGGPGSPSLSFAQDADTGFYLWAVGGPVGFSVDGARQYAFDSNTIIPSGNGAKDLGGWYSSSNNTGAWRDIFASGTVYADGIQVRQAGSVSSSVKLIPAAGPRGGEIIFLNLDGSGCHSLYFNDGGMVTSSVTCP